MKLSEAAIGMRVKIIDTRFPPELQNRILGLGFVPGSVVEVVREAPLGDPRVYIVRGKFITLRNSEASMIEVMPLDRTIPLSMAEIGKQYKVVRFLGGPIFHSKINAIGLKQGTVLEVKAKRPMIVSINGRTQRIGMGMAEKILVEEI